MTDSDIYEALGKRTEEMYDYLCCRRQEQYEWQLQTVLSGTENGVKKIMALYQQEKPGRVLQEQYGELCRLWEEYLLILAQNAKEPVNKRLLAVRTFQKKWKRHCMENAGNLRKYLQKYDSIMLRIDNALAKQRQQFLEERGKVKEQYGKACAERLLQNAELINSSGSKEQWQTFFWEKIIRPGQPETLLQRLYEQTAESAEREFEMLQSGCTVGEYRVNKNAFMHFAESLKDKSYVRRYMDKRLAENTKEAGIKEKMNQLFCRFTKTAVQRAQGMTDAFLELMFEEFQMEELLGAYADFCRELCRGSLKELCMEGEQLELLCIQLESVAILAENEVIKEIGLKDILTERRKASAEGSKNGRKEG